MFSKGSGQKFFLISNKDFTGISILRLLKGYMQSSKSHVWGKLAGEDFMSNFQVREFELKIRFISHKEGPGIIW
jgi:hypothetical protein